jgi:CheY-like chemotaxis protein
LRKHIHFWQWITGFGRHSGNDKDKEIPSIIFLDINMPIMDGWQFLEEFIALKLDKKVFINIVTSSLDPCDKQKSETFKSRTHHTIEYKTKHIRRNEIEEITNAA